MKIFYFFVFVVILKNEIAPIFCFPPAKLISSGLELFKNNLDKVSKTFSHEEILFRGLVKSLTKYFAQKGGLNNKVNASKLNSENYLDLKLLFLDYKNEQYCKIGLEQVIHTKLSPAVILVDLKNRTSKLPHAHFDAEAFKESNQRVINFTNQIVDLIHNGSYDVALRKTGNILHTIQDFYSHSNWIELGNGNEINRKIGTSDFMSDLQVANKDDPACKPDGCTVVEIPCNEALVSETASLVSSITGLDMSSFSHCPIRYYKCGPDNEIKDNKKLVTGYTGNEKLEDGTPVIKPVGKMKCSHGGIFDNSSFVPSVGGINKDSGSYLLSPRADLHLIAASLAINHTEFFFDSLRERVGDDEKFEAFLSLNQNEKKGNFLKNLFFPCQTSFSVKNSFSIGLILKIFILNYLLSFIYKC